MAVAEEAKQRADDEVSRLADERVSLLLKLRTCKDEMSVIRAEALKEKEALREAYEEGFDMIFNYRYGYRAFTHNICGSQPEVPDGMQDTSKTLSPEFFINPRCPQGVVPAEAASIDVRPSEVTNALERKTPAAVLKIDHSEVGEHLSATEVRLGKEPAFSAQSNQGE